MTYKELRQLSINKAEVSCIATINDKEHELHGVLRFNKDTYRCHEHIEILNDIEIHGLYQHTSWHDEHKFSIMIAKASSIRPQITDIKPVIKELVW